jgi:hypothetical protein
LPAMVRATAAAPTPPRPFVSSPAGLTLGAHRLRPRGTPGYLRVQ